MRTSFLALLCLLALGVSSSHAQDAQDAEKRLRSVHGELREVAAQRKQLEGQRSEANRQLRDADRKVSQSQQTLQQTRDALVRDGARLTELQTERARFSGDLAQRRAELVGLLRAAQAHGGAAPLKALLARDSVSEAERALVLQGYLQRAQLARVHQLTEEIRQRQALEVEIVQRRAALDLAGRRQAEQLQALQGARTERASLLAGIDAQYKDRATREQALGRDAKALQTLLARLKAAAAKAAREAAAAERAAKAAPRSTTTPRRRQTASAPPLQVGGLGWPVSGSLLAAFGGRLPDGRRSGGVLIAAPAGTLVKAVAAGSVVFADWMTGYGNILIVDHGNGYMSLYAHNDGLLRKAGDAVKRGDALATVGSSGGQGQPALYFELRRDGEPVNPASWLSRQ